MSYQCYYICHFSSSTKAKNDIQEQVEEYSVEGTLIAADQQFLITFWCSKFNDSVVILVISQQNVFETEIQLLRYL